MNDDTRATPDWWTDLENEALACLEIRGLSAVELSHKLGMSEAAVASVVAMLAADGRVHLSLIERAS